MQEAQQRIAELTADAEENVSGVRVVKAFAQEAAPARALRAHRPAASSPSRSAPPGSRRFYTPADQLPAQPRPGRDPARRRPRGDRRHAQRRRVHRLLRLPADADLADADARLHARRRAALDRIGRADLPDPRPRARDRLPAGRARRCRPAAATWCCAGRRPDLRGHHPPGAVGHLARDPRRADRRAGRRDGLGQVRARAAAAAAVRRQHRVGARSTAPTCARSSWPACAARSRSSTTTRSCSRPRCTTTSPTRAPTPPARQVVRAARAAQAEDFIERLPEGYDTRIGERGLTLSGGQRQRIAIARAILADPRILILDDATSSVDASTEQEIKAALGEVLAGRTTFVIAHRLSTIALARADHRARGRPRGRRRHPRRAARALGRCTARSSRRACPTRCSSTASRSNAEREPMRAGL